MFKTEIFIVCILGAGRFEWIIFFIVKKELRFSEKSYTTSSVENSSFERGVTIEVTLSVGE